MRFKTKLRAGPPARTGLRARYNRLTMPSPFPGMDPYLEGQVWKDFHGLFLPAIKTDLVRQVRPKYEVLIQEDVYVEYEEDRRRRTIEPDVLIAGTPPRPASGATAIADLPAPVQIALPALVPDEERHTCLEIRRLPGRRLVTVLELLSPTNKVAGDKGRDRYLEKRRDIQNSNVHLVELDLLRGGTRLPMDAPLPAGAYYLIVARGDRRPMADVTAFGLRDPLPALIVPLLEEDRAVIDLQALFERVYESAGYDYVLDYDAPASPPLEEPEAAWAEARVARWRSAPAG